MKKIFVIPAVIAMTFISCSKDQEIETEDISSGITEFEADIPESKTYLGEKGASGWPNYWSNGDVIYVHNVTSKALETGDGYVGTNYARFSMNGGVSPVGGKYYAAYPAARMSGWNSSTKKATVTIPATQTFIAGNYDPSAYIMVGTSTTPRLNFSPVMGLIKLTTTSPAEGTLYIKSVSVEPVGDEAMSGTFTTDFAGLSGGTASSSIEISANTGSGSNATKPFGTVFTFVVPTQTYASGLRFRITATANQDGTGEEQTMVFAKQTSFTVTTGALYPLTAPAFKESSVTISLVRALTSSSIQIRWDGSNVSNNRKKTWRIHAYTNSTCTTEFGSGWTITKDDAACWDESNSYLTFVVGGLSSGTPYWFKVEDVQNGVFSSPSSQVTTQSFSSVQMPASITATGVVLAEDFSQLPWGSTVCFRRSAGFRPSNTNSFSNLSTDGATFYRWDSEFSFRDAVINTALTNSRLNDWMSESYVYAKPGHIKLGTSSGAGWILTPPFPSRAVVDVSVSATKYNASAQSDYAVAVLHADQVGTGSGYRQSSFTWPDTSNELLYKIISFSSNDEWQSRTASGLVVAPGDRIVIGRSYDGGNSNPRLFINSISVEATSLIYVINSVATLQYFMENKPEAAIVTADINMSGQSFTTIADYTGTLYGNGHTISGLTVPMFATLKGEVRDLTVNSTINITSKTQDLGIIARKMDNNSKLIGCTSKGSITYCPSSAVTSGEQRTGGLVGYLNVGSLENCKNEASVTVDDNSKSNTVTFNVGGIVGMPYNYTTRQYITNCTNLGNVTNNISTSGMINVGGIAGKPWKVTFTDCKNENASADITISNSGNAGTINIGGFSGQSNVDCVYSGICYNAEAVQNTGTGSTSVRVGGFVAQVNKKNTFDASSSVYHYNRGSVTENSESETIYVAGFCAFANEAVSDFSYCRNSGDVTFSNTHTSLFIGGFAGAFDNSSVIDYTQNSGDIAASGATMLKTGCLKLGGIIGGWINEAGAAQTITGCINSGIITLRSDHLGTTGSGDVGDSFVGGIAGGGPDDNGICSKTLYGCQNSGTIRMGDTGSANSGKLYHRFCVGGIIGWTDVNPTNSKCIADVRFRTTSGTNRVGGIAGEMEIDTIHDVTYKGTVNSNGTSGTNYTGGLVGNVGTGTKTFNNCTMSGTAFGPSNNNKPGGIFCSCNGDGTGPTINIINCKVGSGTRRQTGSSSYSVTITNAEQITAANVFGHNGTDKSCTAGTNSGNTVVDPGTITL